MANEDTMLASVGEFHKTFEIDEPKHPMIPGLTGPVRAKLLIAAGAIREASRFLHQECEANNGAVPLMRGHLMSEELAEILEALAGGDLVEVLHELVDLEVVHKGSVRALGFPKLYPHGQRLIHAANMSKLGGDGKPIKNAAGRILKGPNFKKADLSVLFEPEFFRREVENT